MIVVESLRAAAPRLSFCTIISEISHIHFSLHLHIFFHFLDFKGGDLFCSNLI